MKRLTIVGWVAGCVLVLAELSCWAREWTDRSGAYRVEAELVSIRNGKVYLEKADGKVISVPVDRLSTRDVRHLASLPEGRAYFDALPPAEREKLLGPEQNASSARPSPPRSAPASARPAMARIFVSDKNDVGEVGRFNDLRWGVESLAFSPNGRFLAAGKMDRTVLVFDLVKAAQVAAVEDLSELGSIGSLAFTPDGRKLLGGGRTGVIAIWNVSSNGELRPAGRFAGHSKNVSSITVSAQGTHVLSGDEDKKVRCWTLADAREQFVIDGFRWPVRATFITQSGKQGLASDGAVVALLDMKTGKAIQKMELADGLPSTVTIAPDGSRIVIADFNGVQSWVTTTGMKYPTLGEQGLPGGAEFVPNGRYLLSGGNGKVSLWDLTSHQKIHEFNVAQTFVPIKMIAASPDNRHFAAIPGSAGRDLQIFRMPSSVAKPSGQ